MVRAAVDRGVPEGPRVVDLDHAATTRLRPEVRDAMEPFLTERYGNPSGTHAAARDAVRALDEAREHVADVLGCTPGEVVFTSGGTESDVHAVSGGLPPRPGVPVCSAAEHHAVLDTVTALGGAVVAVDRAARIDLDHLRNVLTGLTTAAAAEHGPRPSVVSVMLANNELGTVTDLAAVAAVVAEVAPGTPLHTDAVQAAPWLDVAALAAPADLVSISAHKLGGPRGSGVLVVRDRVRIGALLHGGGQERGRRSGSVDVASAVGSATALRAVAAERDATARRVGELRDRLLARLTGDPSSIRATLAPAASGGPAVLPNFAHVLVADVATEPLLFLLDDAGLRVSAASSCSSGAQRPSHVLDAVAAAGADVAGSALRLTLGTETTAADVDHAAATILRVVAALRDRVAARSGPAPGAAPTAAGDRVGPTGRPVRVGRR